MIDWRLYPNFTEEEFRCKHTGKCPMHPDFLARLQRLRAAYGKPLTITSGYRDPTHPIEAKKPVPGAHATGRAADIGVTGGEALEIVRLALEFGFTGLGVQQKGGGRFIHVDDVPGGPGMPRPSIWSY